MGLWGISLGLWLDIFERAAIYFYCIRFKCIGVDFYGFCSWIERFEWGGLKLMID